MGVDAGGAFVNTQYQIGAAANPTSSFSVSSIDGLNFGSHLSRFRMADLSLVHNEDRTQYRITGFKTYSDILAVLQAGTPSRYESTGVQGLITRQITTNLAADLSGIFSKYDFSGRKFDIYQTSLMFRYNLTMEMQVYVSGAYMRRITESALAAASPISASLADVSVTVGVRREFF
jgi:hypothetical protein